MLFSSHLPRWLQVLLSEKFFNACIIHEDAKKTRRISIAWIVVSVFALTACPLTVLTGFYRLDDATRLMDCAFVQVNYLLGTEDGVSKFLFECNFLPLPEAGSEDGFVTPDSVLEPDGSIKTSSGSAAYGEVSLNSTATTEIVRKKRSNLKACRPTTLRQYLRFREV
ncbi:Detected protein of unknown function [Hibiscus syriacus]|uniref:Uncharacterized protein n=1 Tax=Hibiscus syriacus TaxID=106335 RepID=A0A6A2XUZ5_HIBSY|nr:Detected protein of unknown function [Hibiscus syriacus]